MQVAFPAALRCVGFDAPQLVGQSRAPMQSINGAVSVQPSLAGRWTYSAQFMVTNEASVLALTAFVVGMEGMIGTTLVPIRQRYGARDIDGNRVSAQGLAMLGDNAPYEGRGGVAFEHFGFENAPVVVAHLVSAAALRATRVAMEFDGSAGLRPGQMFSIGEGLYVAQLVWVDADGDIQVQFQPPLRAAAAAGAVVVLDRLHCRMRFASEDVGAQAFDLTGVSTVSLKFQEA